MLKIKISGIVFELPNELVVQIPYFNDLYENAHKKDCIIDINEPTILLNSLTYIIELFQGSCLPMQIEHIPTFEFLGLDYTLKKELTLFEFYNDQINIYEPFKLSKYFTMPLITDQRTVCYLEDNNKYYCPISNVFNFVLQRGCELVDKVYIKIELPKLNYGAYWKNKVGLQLIKKIEFTGNNGDILLNAETSLIELEYDITNNKDYWKIFEYPEETRKNLSCNSEAVNTIIIPFRFCENKNYAFNLIALTFTCIQIKIYLNDITGLIEGLYNPSVNMMNIQLRWKQCYADNDCRRYLAGVMTRLKTNFIIYDFLNLKISNSNTFNLVYKFREYYDDTIPVLIIIKINGVIVSENFKKAGKYYITQTKERNIDLTVQLKDIGNYDINIIFKYATIIYYRGGFVYLMNEDTHLLG